MNTSARIGLVAVVGEDMKKVSKDEKQEWLSRGFASRKEYNRLQRERNSRLADAAKCTPTYGGIVVAGSSNPHKFERVALIHDDIEERLEEIKQIRAEIQSAIYKLKHEGEREVLFERYVNFRPFKDIGPMVGYSEGHVYVLHRQGLEHIRISRAMVDRSKAKKKKTH